MQRQTRRRDASACGNNRNVRQRGAVGRPAALVSSSWRLFTVRPLFAAQRSPRLRLQNAERLADANEIVEFFAFLGSQFPVTVLCRQLVHAAPVGLGQLKSQNARAASRDKYGSSGSTTLRRMAISLIDEALTVDITEASMNTGVDP